MSGELKPCAHCGRNAALGINERLHHTVGCSWCDACVGASTGYRTTDAAIAAWNRRAPAWEGIESAPRDGAQFLALVSNGWHALVSAPAEALREGWPYQWWRSSDRQSYPVVDTHPEGYNWSHYSTLLLTHWQPLPAAPADGGK